MILDLQTFSSLTAMSDESGGGSGLIKAMA